MMTRLKRYRIRGFIAAVLIAVSPVMAACNPAQLEGVVNSLSTSFEEGGTEGAFWNAAGMVMQAGYAIGLPLPPF